MTRITFSVSGARGPCAQKLPAEFGPQMGLHEKLGAQALPPRSHIGAYAPLRCQQPGDGLCTGSPPPGEYPVSPSLPPPYESLHLPAWRALTNPKGSGPPGKPGYTPGIPRADSPGLGPRICTGQAPVANKPTCPAQPPPANRPGEAPKEGRSTTPRPIGFPPQTLAISSKGQGQWGYG